MTLLQVLSRLVPILQASVGSVAGTGVTAAAATEGAANFQALEAMLTYLHESSAVGLDT